MPDLFDEPKDQEEIWREEIARTQINFQLRVEEALQEARNKTRRKAIYQRWRKELGDDIARESARFVEALIKGTVKWPKWFR